MNNFTECKILTDYLQSINVKCQSGKYTDGRELHVTSIHCTAPSVIRKISSMERVQKLIDDHNLPLCIEDRHEMTRFFFVHITDECQVCDGTGKVCYSCCGDDVKGNDIDLCPTCYEHCPMDETECDYCEGKGYFPKYKLTK